MKTQCHSKRLFQILLCLVVATSMMGQVAKETTDQAIERLIKPLFDSTFQARRAENALAEIRSMPGITDILFRKFEAEITNDGPSYRVAALMRSLAERSDYSPEMMASIRSKTIWALKSLRSNEKNAHFLAEGNLRILGNNPSAQNEDVLISALSSEFDTATGVQEVAVHALQKSGTARAKAALDELAKRIMPRPGNKNRLYDLVTETAPIVAARASTEQTSGTPPQSNPPQAKQPNVPKLATETTAMPQPESKSWLVWLLVVVAATVGAAWVFLRKSK